MIEILHEFYVQIITVIFMTGIIIAAIVLGHKARKAMDKKKENKITEEAENTAK